MNLLLFIVISVVVGDKLPEIEVLHDLLHNSYDEKLLDYLDDGKNGPTSQVLAQVEAIVQRQPQYIQDKSKAILLLLLESQQSCIICSETNLLSIFLSEEYTFNCVFYEVTEIIVY
ncbi:unnamed protein product [Enterobius vermicularis]|uniref:Secreted protein n=1 Tax=Enterobius vermicularis TaxID=51028 RepID=A0A0N4V2M8_ENTVE|nr:unnamed protein product [Enterobius vermicularis]